jgi:hypothetical protein
MLNAQTFHFFKLPDWAHGWFSALDKDMLMMSANVANFLTATPFVEHFALFLAVKVCISQLLLLSFNLT